MVKCYRQTTSHVQQQIINTEKKEGILFVILTMVWVAVMGVVTIVFFSGSSAHGIEALLIGLGFWVWLATMYISYQLGNEGERITDRLDEIKEIQEQDHQLNRCLWHRVRATNKPREE